MGSKEGHFQGSSSCPKLPCGELATPAAMLRNLKEAVPTLQLDPPSCGTGLNGSGPGLCSIIKTQPEPTNSRLTCNSRRTCKSGVQTL